VGAVLSNSKVLASIGIGFALPANETQFAAGGLEDPERAARNRIGSQLPTLTARLATIVGRADRLSATVIAVIAGSLAAEADMRPSRDDRRRHQRRHSRRTGSVRWVTRLPGRRSSRPIEPSYGVSGPLNPIP
jgi:S1-C subfamily serine protease